VSLFARGSSGRATSSSSTGYTLATIIGQEATALASTGPTRPTPPR